MFERNRRALSIPESQEQSRRAHSTTGGTGETAGAIGRKECSRRCTTPAGTQEIRTETETCERHRKSRSFGSLATLSLSLNCPTSSILLICASDVVKSVSNVRSVGRAAESFDVVETSAKGIFATKENVKLLCTFVTGLEVGYCSGGLLQAAAVDPQFIDSIVLGNCIQTSKDSPYLARHMGLRIGLEEKTRLCGSGFQSIINAAPEILLDESKIVLAGGTESMSQAPFVVRWTRFGTMLGQKIEFEDALWEGLTDLHIKTPMGITAENLGMQCDVTREDAHEFALKSQTRWRLANNAGNFKLETAPVPIKTRKGEVMFDTDEHPREVTKEGLAKLPAVFRKEGLVTAGNASGVSDGAAAVVVASEEAVKEHHLTPLARILGWHAVGVDPHFMGIGPAPAIRAVLDKTKLTLDQMDLVEVNEAFAPQALSGGAIAFGHPLAASGSRIIVHLVHELRHGLFAPRTCKCVDLGPWGRPTLVVVKGLRW